MHDPSLFSLQSLIRQVSSCVMEGRWTWHRDGLDIDVSVESVLIEENSTACIMGHVEATRKNVVINIFGRLLQGNDMPPACDLLFEGIFFSASGSRVPVLDAQSLLRNWSGSKMFVDTVCGRRCRRFPFWCFEKTCCSLMDINHTNLLEDNLLQFEGEPSNAYSSCLPNCRWQVCHLCFVGIVDDKRVVHHENQVVVLSDFVLLCWKQLSSSCHIVTFLQA